MLQSLHLGIAHIDFISSSLDLVAMAAASTGQEDIMDMVQRDLLRAPNEGVEIDDIIWFFRNILRRKCSCMV